MRGSRVRINLGWPQGQDGPTRFVLDDEETHVHLGAIQQPEVHVQLLKISARRLAVALEGWGALLKHSPVQMEETVLRYHLPIPPASERWEVGLVELHLAGRELRLYAPGTGSPETIYLEGDTQHIGDTIAAVAVALKLCTATAE